MNLEPGWLLPGTALQAAAALRSELTGVQVALTAAEVQAGNTITRQGSRMTVRLTQDLTANATTALPVNPKSGDIITFVRQGGGFFTWTINLASVLLVRDDQVVYVRSSGQWVEIVPPRIRKAVYRRATGGDSIQEEASTVQVFTAASSYRVMAAQGQSTGWNVTLVQRGTGVVTASLETGVGLVQVPSGGPLVTNGDGTALYLESIGSSQVKIIRLVVDPAASSGDLDIQPDVTGTTLTADDGLWYPLSNGTSCAVTLDGATFADERSSLVEARAVPSGAYTLTPAATYTINGGTAAVTLAKFVGAKATIYRAGQDFRVDGDLVGTRDFGDSVAKNVRGFYDELSGTQTLSAAVAPASATLANTGAAATWILPSRVASATNSADSVQVLVHNVGSGALTFSASGPTLVGATSLTTTQSATIEWVRKGTGTERVIVRVTT